MEPIKTQDELLATYYPGIWAWLNEAGSALALLHKPLIDIVRAYAIDLRGIWYFDACLSERHPDEDQFLIPGVCVSFITSVGHRVQVSCSLDEDDALNMVRITILSNLHPRDCERIPTTSGYVRLESMWQFIHGERPRVLTRLLAVEAYDADDHKEMCDLLERALQPRLLRFCVAQECRDAAIRRIKRLARKRRRSCT